MKQQRTLTAQINHDHGQLAAPCFTTHRADTQYTPLGKKDVAALHLSCRRCKSVYKLGLWGKTVLWRCCKSVHETIASRHVSCIQFSDVSAAQVHSHCQEKHRGALLRAQSYNWKILKVMFNCHVPASLTAVFQRLPTSRLRLQPWWACIHILYFFCCMNLKK